MLSVCLIPKRVRPPTLPRRCGHCCHAASFLIILIRNNQYHTGTGDRLRSTASRYLSHSQPPINFTFLPIPPVTFIYVYTHTISYYECFSPFSHFRQNVLSGQHGFHFSKSRLTSIKWPEHIIKQPTILFLLFLLF